MAWNQGDDEYRAAAKLQLAALRAASYSLLKTVKQVSHPEKGPRLIELTEQFKQVEDQIEFQLNR